MGTVPDDPAVFVLVEAQQDPILRVPAGLGDPVADHPIGLSSDRVAVGSAGAPEERHDIAHRRHADPEHQRILGGIDELVDQVRIEAVPETDHRLVGRAGERRGGAVGERPVAAGNFHHPGAYAHVVLARDGDQFRLRRIEAVGRAHALLHRIPWTINKRLRVDVARNRHEAGEGRPGHTLDHGYIDRFRRQRRIEHQIALPAARQVDVSGLLVKAISRRVGRRDPDVAKAEGPTPAVTDAIYQDAAGPAHVDRLEHREGRRVLDVAVGVTRRLVNVGDDRIARIQGIEFTLSRAPDLLVSPDVTKRLPVER